MIKLFHFTCDHGALQIRETMRVIPGNQRAGGKSTWPVSWWTDLAEPEAWQLGLDSKILTCNRLEFRFRALSFRGIYHFDEWGLGVAKTGSVNAKMMQALTVNTEPARWWVGLIPIAVEEVPR